jgi:hypothetical protein
LHDVLDLSAEILDDGEVRPEDLDPDGRLDPGEQHVEPVTDRLRPHVREAGKLQLLIHFRLELLERHARARLLARFERHRGRVLDRERAPAR